VGGPIIDEIFKFEHVCFIFVIFVASVLLVGFPRYHGAAVGAACVVRAGRTNTGVSPRLLCTVLQPPNMLLIIASLQCPVAWRLHVELVCSELRVTPWLQQ
jgi:hypothetical protein